MENVLSVLTNISEVTTGPLYLAMKLIHRHKLSHRPCNVSVDDSLLLLMSPWLWTSGTLGTPWAHTRGKLSRHIPRVDTKGCAASGLVRCQYPGLWLVPAPAPMLVTKRQSTSELVQQLSPGSGGGYHQMRPVICAWQTELWHDISYSKMIRHTIQ